MSDVVVKRSRRSAAASTALARVVARHLSRPGSDRSVTLLVPWVLVEHDEDVAELDLLAGCDGNPSDPAGTRGTKLVLHLHRLDDQELLSGGHLVAGCDRDRDDGSGDDRTDFCRPVPLGVAALATGPGTECRPALGFELHLHEPAVDDHLATDCARRVGLLRPEKD